MLVDFGQGVEISDQLGEPFAIYSAFSLWRTQSFQTFLDGMVDRFGQAFTGPRSELADFCFGRRIFDDDAHEEPRIYYTNDNIYRLRTICQCNRRRRQRYLFLPLHRAPTDIVAIEPFRPADAGDRLVGARLRLAHRLADCRDVEHAAAIGEDAVAVGLGAGVEDFHALDFGGVVQAFDDRAAGVFSRIALGGHHHGQRR